MIRSLFSVLFLLLNFVILLGQPLEIYQPLECTGEIPESFIVPSTQKYQGDILEIELLAQSRKDKKNTGAICPEKQLCAGRSATKRTSAIQ
jgi:hypothetical protein